MTSHDPDFAHAVDEDVVQKTTLTKPMRLLSVDVMRGLTIALMIVVNDQVGRAPFTQLSHAAWNGVTLTDLVFPTFLFLVGLTTVLSISARLARGARRHELFFHALRRALLLIVFGFIVNNFPFLHLQHARYYGVLPRSGICYFVAASLYLLSTRWQSKVVIAVGCLLGYWVLLRFIPVPGFGVPTHDLPINDHDGNLAAWLDRSIFSASHLYERTRDPEGLLSTLPAIGTTLFGLLAAVWLRSSASIARKATMLAVAGTAMMMLALCWNPWFPMNKKLWTSSYALFAGGCSSLLLAACLAVVDIWRVGRSPGEGSDPASTEHPTLYKPWLVFGTNAILAYMISELGDSLLHLIPTPSGIDFKLYVWSSVLAVIPQPAWASLTYSLLYLGVCWLMVYPFYRKRIFLRI